MRIAVVDMGTNTFNLLIVEVYTNKQYQIIFKDKAGVKLGKDGINNRRITSQAFKRGIEAISHHLDSIKKYKADKIVTIATSAARSTENGKEFVEAIEKEFRIKVQVISGDKEAELVYRGVKQAVELNDKNMLILDIGGGSNEFIIANNTGILWKQSFQLGMARLLDLFNPSDPIRNDEVIRIEKYIELNLKDLFDAVALYKPDTLIGCSGTFDSFRSMISIKKGVAMNEIEKNNSYPIDINDYHDLHEELLRSTLEERKKMEGLEFVRIEMIVVASIFVNFIIEKLRINSLIQSAYSIKEGMIDKILNS